jgi:hypothetical protein
MDLKEFASELAENKEEKIIESTKLTAGELMPRLNEYKIKLSESTDALAQAKAAIKRKDPAGDAYVKDGKYIIKYNGRLTAYGSIEDLLKAAVGIQTSR